MIPVALAMTWDGTTQKFYYDGVVNTTNTQSQNTTLTQKIGFGCNLGLGECWTGKIYDAFVVGRALSLAEVGSLYTNAPNTALAVPTGVAATPVSSGTVNASWAADTNATSRSVSVTNTSTSFEQVFTTAAATSYSATGLTNGTVYDFKILATNALGSRGYSSVVSATATLSTACDILTFVFPNQLDTVISGTNISLTVPTGTNVSALAPTFTVSPNATGSPVSGTPLNFTDAQTYTVTAEDTVTAKTYTVTEGAVPNIFTWAAAVAGNWSDSSKWTNNLASGSKPIAQGQSDCCLNFTQTGTYTFSQNLSNGFVLNQLNFAGAVTLAGTNSLALTGNGATLPTINQNSASEVAIVLPVSRAANVTVAGSGNGQVSLGGLVAGSGRLIKNSSGGLQLRGHTV